MEQIPFNKPYLAGKELYYIAQAVLSGHTSGDGAFTRRCQSFMENRFGAEKVLLTHSCTAALEMAALLCEIEPGDEVILPSFTFVSTANAFFLRGARFAFVDILKDTLNIDHTRIEEAITERTKVIVPVHYAGIGCDMDAIMKIARKHDLLVVEDAAQGVNAKYRDKFLGTIGDLGTYSFHETKNCICGEGGAILINNPRFAERAEVIRDKGTDRGRFLRGEVSKYTWVGAGSSFLPSDILAAFLCAQLENIDTINKRRCELFDYYYRALMPLANDGELRLPYVSSDVGSNSHLFYIILKDESTRNTLIEYLKNAGIMAVFHYVPLHLSPVGREMGYRDGQLPMTESLSGRLLRLPFYFDMTHGDLQRVVEAIKQFFAAR